MTLRTQGPLSSLRSVSIAVWKLVLAPTPLVIATVARIATLGRDQLNLRQAPSRADVCDLSQAGGPGGQPPEIVLREYEHADLDPILKARERIYEHVGIVLETLRDLGYEAGVDAPQQTSTDR
jgi:hypothetical protein